MKTLIAYGTKYGCTAECANLLKNHLSGEIQLMNLKNGRPVNLEQYDRIIIGGSIYMGSIQKEVKEFCEGNLGLLKEKKIGLFICCMRDGEMVEEQLKNAFPQDIYGKAIAKESFGGEFIFKKMSFLDKLIVKKVSKVSSDTSNILNDNIKKFAEIISNS